MNDQRASFHPEMCDSEEVDDDSETEDEFIDLLFRCQVQFFFQLPNMVGWNWWRLLFYAVLGNYVTSL